MPQGLTLHEETAFVASWRTAEHIPCDMGMILAAPVWQIITCYDMWLHRFGWMKLSSQSISFGQYDCFHQQCWVHSNHCFGGGPGVGVGRGLLSLVGFKLNLRKLASVMKIVHNLQRFWPVDLACELRVSTAQQISSRPDMSTLIP